MQRILYCNLPHLESIAGRWPKAVYPASETAYPL
jgi:hypothetical protein